MLEFKRRFLTYTDEQLLKIVTQERDTYQESALRAAEEILAERNIEFEIPQGDNAELVDEFANADMGEEINERIQRGEDVEMIKSSLKAKGIKTEDILHEEAVTESATEDAMARKLRRRKIGGTILIVVGALRFLIALGTSEGALGFLVGIVAIIGGIAAVSRNPEKK